MDKKRSDFFQNSLTAVLPLILSVVLSSALYSVYSINLFSVWTLGIILVTAVMFLFCRFIDKHHFIGGAIFVVVLMFALYWFMVLIAGNDYGQTFQQWFLTGADKVQTKTSYLLALMVSFVPFFAVTVYYFSMILYRMSFLTLISLIPCAVYVKVLSDIDNVYVALIALLNVAILMSSVRQKRENGRMVVGKGASLMSAAVFTFVLLIISAAIPKEENARYYDRFEELFMDTSNNNRLFSDYTYFSEFSGGADSFRGFSNRRMYTVYGPQDPYFKRQTFDYYDFENDRWYADDSYSEPYYTDYEWTAQAGKLSLAQLQKAIKAADGYESGFAAKYGMSGLSDYEQITDDYISVTIQPENFGAVYYIAPVRAVSVTPVGQSEQIYVTRSGVFRNREQPHAAGMPYTVTFYDEYYTRYRWFALGGADIDDEKCGEMLNELYTVLMQNRDDLADTAEAFLQVYNDAMDYKSIYRENDLLIPDRVRELAQQITAGLTYDWEKASALQNYFIQNNYAYDLNYVAPDPSVEYFLFDSKRGSCSDYAAAFVLMARSVGLTARYAEGYSPDVTSRDSVFAISDSCSHAYPEVYIQNMGWAVFEPTVPSGYNELESDTAQGGVNFKVDYNLVFVLCVIAAIVFIIALIVIICAPAVSEKLFMGRLEKASAGDSAVIVYKRLSGRICAKLIPEHESLTPYEFAEALEKLTGCDISKAVFILEKCSYGCSQADDSDKQTVTAAYSEAFAAVKEYKKNERKMLHEKRFLRNRT